MTIRGRMFRTALYAGGAAAATWFFDPERGRGRRIQARDQASAALRRAEHQAEVKLRRAQGRAEGALHRMDAVPPDPPADDQVLADRVRSALGGRLPPDVNLTVVERVVELRGEVGSEAAVIDLTDSVSRVPHVSGVTNLLHLPGQPAPNKAEALDASATAAPNGSSTPTG